MQYGRTPKNFKLMTGAVPYSAYVKSANISAQAVAVPLLNSLNSVPEAFFILDRELHFAYVNPAAAEMLRYTPAEMIGKMIWDLFPQAIGGTSYYEYSRALNERCVTTFQEYYPPLNRWFEARCLPCETGVAVHFYDITDVRRERDKLNRAKTAFHMLSQVNNLLVRAEREDSLVQQVCEIALKIGGYQSACVVYADTERLGPPTVACLSSDQDAHDFARDLAQSFVFRAAGGQDMLAEVMRNRAPIVVAESETDPSLAPAAAIARNHCFKTLVLLPIFENDKLDAIIALCSQAELDLHADELGVLKELSVNLAFGLETIRVRDEHKKLHAALSSVAASVTAGSGELFFQQLALNMALSVGADGAIIAKLLEPDSGKARTVACVLDGSPQDNFDYLIAASPCSDVLAHQQCTVASELAVRFPDSPAAAFEANAYAGWRLVDSSNVVIGVIFVFFKDARPRISFANAALQIFAARAAAELERQASEAQLIAQSLALDQAQDGIIIRDRDDKIILWNGGAERMYGWSKKEALGRNIQDLLATDASDYHVSRRQVLESGFWEGEIARFRKDGSVANVELRLSSVNDSNGIAQGILSISTDVTRRKIAEQRAEKLAFYDPVTELPNRALILDRLQRALLVCERSSRAGVLILVDIDHFKSLNDSLGFDNGDQILQEVARRLRASLFDTDSLARFGGDEFVIIIENSGQEPSDALLQSTLVCQKVMGIFEQPFYIGDVEQPVTASAGVSLFCKETKDLKDLLAQADFALRQAKASGGGCLRFFDTGLQTAVAERASIEQDLRKALRDDEFVLHYQPQVDADGTVVGAEALIRWNSAARGWVGPAVFIPIAEESGRIIEIGRWVLECACKQLAIWATKPTLANLTISVNVSVRQIRDRHFVADLLNALQRTAAPPNLLKLEITESLLISDAEATIGVLNQVKLHGVGISLDDFGTGYSSLSYLRMLPLDQLKIDQSFVRDISGNLHDEAIARTIVELGRSLGLTVVAEGVETVEQLHSLKAMGCAGFQGYWFAKPLSTENFEQYVAAANQTRD